MQTDEQENNNQEEKEEEQQQTEIKVEEPKPKTFNRTSILLARSHDDKNSEDECSYCDGKRIVDDPITGEKDIHEEKLKYNKLGFTTTKMRADDLEKCLNNGFTRCGTYIYQRSSRVSCCEVWQYRVNTDEFQMSQGQKKVIRRLHKYLDYGSIHGNQEEEKKQEEKVVSNVMMKVENEEAKKIIDQLKEPIGQYLISTYLIKAEDEQKLLNFDFEIKFNDLRDKILKNHKITYN